jgi:hypothetical protein
VVIVAASFCLRVLGFVWRRWQVSVTAVVFGRRQAGICVGGGFLSLAAAVIEDCGSDGVFVFAWRRQSKITTAVRFWSLDGGDEDLGDDLCRRCRTRRRSWRSLMESYSLKLMFGSV